MDVEGIPWALKTKKMIGKGGYNVLPLPIFLIFHKSIRPLFQKVNMDHRDITNIKVR